MRMAKATEADLKNATEITNAIELMTQSGHRHRCMPDSEEEFWPDDAEQCKKALHYLLNRARGLNRVVFGCAVLLDPINKIVDQSLDYLDRHPKEHPTLEQCAQVAKSGGLPDTAEERARFEAYMRSLNWVDEYNEERGGYCKSYVRCAYVVWRDRGALAMAEPT